MPAHAVPVAREEVTIRQIFLADKKRMFSS
jgi:hypothetical protein